MAASAANGVARRTKIRVLKTDSEPAPGNTPDASPPLAGWKVRRRQSVSTEGDASAPLKEVAKSPSALRGAIRWRASRVLDGLGRRAGERGAPKFKSGATLCKPRPPSDIETPPRPA